MSIARDRGRLDWLVEMAGASAPAAAAAFAGARLGPAQGWPIATAVLLGFGAIFTLAYATARLVPAEPHILALADFDRSILSFEAQADDVLLLDNPLAPEPLAELLLDRVFTEPSAIKAATEAVAELLLDDPLPAPDPDSRVVQLFANGRMPTAGQLQQRIDRHLAAGERPGPVQSDASDTLSEALAELRRSLRQA